MLTVQLSITRWLNISLLATILVSHKFPSIEPAYLFLGIFSGFVFSQFILPWSTNLLGRFDFTNYFATPLPEILEMILPYIGLYILYNRMPNNVSSSSYNKYLLAIGAYYTYGLYRALFPPSHIGIDKMAADGFWERHRFLF